MGNYVKFFVQLCLFLYNRLKASKHRGEILLSTVKKKRIKVSDLSQRFKLSRSTFYNHTKQKNLSYELLAMYGKAIGHDFTQDISDMPDYLLQEEEPLYNIPTTLDDALKIIEQWKNKFIKLSIQYQELIAKLAARKD